MCCNENCPTILWTFTVLVQVWVKKWKKSFGKLWGVLFNVGSFKFVFAFFFPNKISSILGIWWGIQHCRERSTPKMEGRMLLTSTGSPDSKGHQQEKQKSSGKWRMCITWSLALKYRSSWGDMDLFSLDFPKVHKRANSAAFSVGFPLCKGLGPWRFSY